MLEDPDPATVGKVMSQFSTNSTATSDVHYLIVLSRLKGKRTDAQTVKLAEVLLGLNKKLQGKQLRLKQTWGDRLAEVVANLLEQHPTLADELLKHAEFINPASLSFTVAFNQEQKRRAAREFFVAIRENAEFAWSPELVDLLAVLPPSSFRPHFRKHWTDYSLRDTILKHLSVNPEVVDRDRFLMGLESSNPEIIRQCLAVLMRLPRYESAKNLVPLVKRLQILMREKKEPGLCEKLIELIEKQSGKLFDSAVAISPWFEATHPKEAKLLNSAGGVEMVFWTKQLALVPWEKANVERGAKVFQQRSCATCHSTGSRIGPDLTGITGRFCATTCSERSSIRAGMLRRPIASAT